MVWFDYTDPWRPTDMSKVARYSSLGSDETILHSLVREVSEETSMQVTQIMAQVGGMKCATVNGLRWGKICFMTGVEEITGRKRTRRDLRRRRLPSSCGSARYNHLKNPEAFPGLE